MFEAKARLMHPYASIVTELLLLKVLHRVGSCIAHKREI